VTGLFGPDHARIGDLRGRWLYFNGIPTLVTYHPSYLLRNGTTVTKRQVWEDMLAVMQRLNMPISERQRGYFLSSAPCNMD
jgi:DNA polymerase